MKETKSQIAYHEILDNMNDNELLAAMQKAVDDLARADIEEKNSSCSSLWRLCCFSSAISISKEVAKRGLNFPNDWIEKYKQTGYAEA